MGALEAFLQAAQARRRTRPERLAALDTELGELLARRAHLRRKWLGLWAPGARRQRALVQERTELAALNERGPLVQVVGAPLAAGAVWHRLQPAWRTLAESAAVWHLQGEEGSFRKALDICPVRAQIGHNPLAAGLPAGILLPTFRGGWYFGPNLGLAWETHDARVFRSTELQLHVQEEIFRTETLPSDATVRFQTWRHLDERGNRDPTRPNSDNPPVYVLSLARLTFTAQAHAGLKGTWLFSNYAAAENFRAAWEEFQSR